MWYFLQIGGFIMISEKKRRYRITVALKHVLSDYLQSIGFTDLSDFYGIESDPKKYIIRFKNCQKMQVVLQDDPMKSNPFNLFLYLFENNGNYEYIMFHCDIKFYGQSYLIPCKHVIKHTFSSSQCVLTQSIGIYPISKIHLEIRFNCCQRDFEKELSIECSHFEILKKALGGLLPPANSMDCYIMQTVDNPVLESHFGPNIIPNIKNVGPNFLYV